MFVWHGRSGLVNPLARHDGRSPYVRPTLSADADHRVHDALAIHAMVDLTEVLGAEGALARFVYVDDCDVWCDRAFDTGCKSPYPATDMFWSDRMGKIKDPYGHYCGIATHKWVLTHEEIKKARTSSLRRWRWGRFLGIQSRTAIRQSQSQPFSYGSRGQANEQDSHDGRAG